MVLKWISITYLLHWLQLSRDWYKKDTYASDKNTHYCNCNGIFIGTVILVIGTRWGVYWFYLKRFWLQKMCNIPTKTSTYNLPVISNIDLFPIGVPLYLGCFVLFLLLLFILSSIRKIHGRSQYTLKLNVQKKSCIFINVRYYTFEK